MLAPRRRDDHPKARQLRQRRQVRLAVAHRLFRLQQRQQLLANLHGLYRLAEDGGDLGGQIRRLQPHGREIQHQATRLARHGQGAGHTAELQALARLAIQFEQRVRGSQGGVAAQRHLAGRGEPADAPARALAHGEGRFGLVVLGGDALHQLVFQPGIQPVDHGRVAAKRPIGEGVDLMKFELHAALPDSRWWPASMPQGVAASPVQSRPIAPLQLHCPEAARTSAVQAVNRERL